jgi:4-aminobutyrate aminotransferase-like enzyme
MSTTTATTTTTTPVTTLDVVDTFWPRANRYLMYTGVPASPVIITKANGTRLHDASGRQILDFTSGQMSSLLGHSHPEIVQVVTKYVGELDHLISNMITEPVVELAERLACVLPAPLEKSFFLNTGSESTENCTQATSRSWLSLQVIMA